MCIFGKDSIDENYPIILMSVTVDLLMDLCYSCSCYRKAAAQIASCK